MAEGDYRKRVYRYLYSTLRTGTALHHLLNLILFLRSSPAYSWPFPLHNNIIVRAAWLAHSPLACTSKSPEPSSSNSSFCHDIFVFQNHRQLLPNFCSPKICLPNHKVYLTPFLLPFHQIQSLSAKQTCLVQ